MYKSRPNFGGFPHELCLWGTLRFFEPVASWPPFISETVIKKRWDICVLPCLLLKVMARVFTNRCLAFCRHIRVT